MTTNPDRIIFLNRFYWPDEPATAQLLADMAETLAGRLKSEIHVITSPPRAASHRSRETHRGVIIVRVGWRQPKSQRQWGRMMAYVSYMLGAAWILLRIMRRSDTVIFMTDPPLLAALISPILSLQGIRHMHWVQDVYPEIAATLTGHRWLNLMRPLRNLSWRRATACIALDQDMVQVIRSAGVPANNIRLIPNWAPAGLVPPPAADVDALRHHWGLRGKFVVLYSGNLGRVHDLETIVAVADHLRDHQDILFAFVGDGAQLAALQQNIRARKLTNVRFFPPQPRAQLGTTLAVGDVHFVTMRAGCEGLVFPSKLVGICAIGRPVIVIGPLQSNLVKLIEKHGLGHGFAAEDIPGMAGSILRLKADPDAAVLISQRSRRYAATHNLEHAAAQWTRLLSAEHALAADTAHHQADR